MNFEKMINYFNQTRPSKESFLSVEWPLVLLHMVHSCIRYVSNCEFNLASCSILPESDGMQPAMHFLEMKLSELHISFAELGNVFGKRMAALLLLSTSHSWTADNGIQQQKAISSRLVNKARY